MMLIQFFTWIEFSQWIKPQTSRTQFKPDQSILFSNRNHFLCFYLLLFKWKIFSLVIHFSSALFAFRPLTCFRTISIYLVLIFFLILLQSRNVNRNNLFTRENRFLLCFFLSLFRQPMFQDIGHLFCSCRSQLNVGFNSNVKNAWHSHKLGMKYTILYLNNERIIANRSVRLHSKTNTKWHGIMKLRDLNKCLFVYFMRMKTHLI